MYGFKQMLLRVVPGDCGEYCYALKDSVECGGFLLPFLENDFFSTLRHSLLIRRHTRWINEFLKGLHLKAAELIPEQGRRKQRAIPRLF